MDYKGDKYYIGQVLGGNTSAFSHLVDHHKDRSFNLAFRICGNREEAEETTQDSFLKAFRSLKSFRMQSSFSTWLYRIVYNTAISQVRTRKNKVLSLEDFPVSIADFRAEENYTDIAEDEYRKSLLNFALQKIPDEDRGLVTLYYFEDMSTEEISEVTGISRTNVKVKLFRARQRMQEIIQSIEKKNLVCNGK